MKNARTSLSLILLLVFVFLVAIPSEATEYLLGVGDVLRISVWGHAELTTEVAIRPDGYLTFPLVGDHWAVDKTTRQLSRELQDILAEFVINPQVTVIVSQFRTLQVQVLGEVRSTGYYQLKSGSRLLDVLALAGGPTKTADLDRISITRYVPNSLGQDRTEVLQINVNDFISNGSLDANPLISSGDMIFVPTSGRATIFGEVRQPTSYDLQGGLDILDLLALAGGALDSADLERVVVTSQTDDGPREITLNVQELLSGRGKAIQINPDDVVFVPKKQQVIVLGAVRAPGLYVLNKETHLVDILAQAGGVLPSGDASSVSITRKYGADQEMVLVNALPSLTGKTGGENPRLQPDDLIFVPEGYQNALVLGQVRTPGSYLVNEQTRLLDLLAQAGGTQELAGEKLVLTRAGVAKEIELGPLERLGLQNEQVLPGDVLYIPEGRKQVLVLGEVRNPGYFQIRSGDRFLDAIGMAGGLTPQADEGQISLSRRTNADTEISMIDFGELTKNRFLQDNVLLQSGDVIIVPKGDRGVTVLGEVERPGYYRFESGDGLLDAIMLAGGFLESAHEEQVSLSRQTEKGTEVTIIDFSRLMEQKYLETDLALQGGDVIMVPKSDRSVLVLGEIRSPGYYVFSKGQRLLDIVARAGGFTEEAQPEQVVMTRQTNDGVDTEILNLNHLESTNGNIVLQGGEIISVPKANRMVLVFGEVVRAGAYTLPPQGRLLDVLALAGGLQSNLSGQEVVLTRQSNSGEQIWQVGFEQLMSAQGEHNLSLVGGDVVYVPASKNQILVLGQVKNPGVYNLPLGARVLDALALAGGPLERAALENVGIYRDGSLDGSELVVMGRDKVLFSGDAKENPLLEAGDIIYVPETKKPDWTKIFGFIGGLKTFKDLMGFTW
jgi:polysaccharide export outer membrane protein